MFIYNNSNCKQTADKKVNKQLTKSKQTAGKKSKQTADILGFEGAKIQIFLK